MKINHKTVVYMLVSILTLTFSSCQLLSEDKSIVLNQGKIFKEDAEGVYSAFRDRDTEELEDMFCEKAAKDQDLRMEIESIFDFIDGNIISYEKFFCSGESTSVEDGKTIRLNGEPNLMNVKTDSGALYRIQFSDILIYDADPTWVGIAEIAVTRIENDSYTDSFKIGVPFDY